MRTPIFPAARLLASIKACTHARSIRIEYAYRDRSSHYRQRFTRQRLLMGHYHAATPRKITIALPFLPQATITPASFSAYTSSIPNQPCHATPRPYLMPPLLQLKKLSANVATKAANANHMNAVSACASRHL